MVENHISNFQPIAAKELSVLHILSVFYLEGEANVPITDLKTLSYFVIHSKKSTLWSGTLQMGSGVKESSCGKRKVFLYMGPSQASGHRMGIGLQRKHKGNVERWSLCLISFIELILFSRQHSVS